MISLIPIWLYQGRQGFHNKILQYACYAFYPVHIIILIFFAVLVVEIIVFIIIGFNII